MFSTFRAIRDASQRCASSLSAIAGLLPQVLQARAETEDLVGRLEDLELSRAKWEAEMEAELLRSQSTLRSANNAESRARTMEKRYEEHSDSGDPDSDPQPEPVWVPPGDVAPSQEDELPPLRMDLEGNNKAYATHLKWSQGG